MLGIAATVVPYFIAGLQIYQNDSWQDVPAIPDTFVINLGECSCGSACLLAGSLLICYSSNDGGSYVDRSCNPAQVTCWSDGQMEGQRGSPL